MEELDTKLRAAFATPNTMMALATYEEIQHAKAWLLGSDLPSSQRPVIYFNTGFNDTFTTEIYDALGKRLNKGKVCILIWDSKENIPNPLPPEMEQLYSRPFPFEV